MPYLFRVYVMCVFQVLTQLGGCTKLRHKVVTLVKVKARGALTEVIFQYTPMGVLIILHAIVI